MVRAYVYIKILEYPPPFPPPLGTMMPLEGDDWDSGVRRKKAVKMMRRKVNEECVDEKGEMRREREMYDNDVDVDDV